MLRIAMSAMADRETNFQKLAQCLGVFIFICMSIRTARRRG